MNTIARNTFGITPKWDTPSGHSPVTDFAKMIYPISEELVEHIDKCTFKQSIKKGKHLLKADEICQYVYFVQKGVLRAYVRDGMKEITTWITAENEMVTSIYGFDLQRPAIENIQAIEDCQLVAFHYDDLQFAYNNFLEMNIVGRKLLEQYYRDAEERAYISRLAKASSRYTHFIETKGALANRIQLKYIASYLGMTIETLSRIRSKMHALPH